MFMYNQNRKTGNRFTKKELTITFITSGNS